MNQLTKIFDNQNLTIIEIEGEAKFLLKDVCEILEIGNHRHVKTRLEDDVVSNYPIKDSLGRTQQATFVNEDGLYDVILDSRKKEAKRFRKWITSDVLPSIRKTGSYQIGKNDLVTDYLSMSEEDRAIAYFNSLKDKKQIEQQRQEELPYTNFGKAVSNSNASINVGSFAKLMYDEHGIKLGRNKLFQWLRVNGYLIAKGREYNQPKQKYIEQGLFTTTVTMVSRTQGDVESVTTLITGKGQVKLSEKLLQEFGVMI